MDPMTAMMLGSLALGALKGSEDSKAAKRRMKIEAIRERWSPYTGRGGQIVDSPSAMGTLMQSLATGAMIGQQFGNNGTGDKGAYSLYMGDDPKKKHPNLYDV